MEKIYNIIPGNLIKDSYISSRIDMLIGSIKFEDWIEVNEKVYSLDFFYQNKKFYVMYLDPRGIIKRLYNTSCSEIVDFMKKRISSEYGEGVDMAVCTMEINNAIICNHDGQIFLLKNNSEEQTAMKQVQSNF